METRVEGKERFFLVTRGKERKGFAKGCIGRVEAEPRHGELVGLLYSTTGGNLGVPKNGGVVKKEDTYPLTRHQAQLLLFVAPPSKRLELLCNPQLFSAICQLSQDDLVVVRHKKGYMPGLVKNLMQVGKKESQGDLLMLGFEVEFVDSDHSLSSRKPAPLPLFNAADIIQVVPSVTHFSGSHWKDGHSRGLNRKAVSRINSMPSLGSRGQQAGEALADPSISPTQVPLEPGSPVEVTSNTGVTVYGVIRWMGVPAGKTSEWAGIELDHEVNGCSDGEYGGQRYFTCRGGQALFVPVAKCSPDSRFHSPPSQEETLNPSGLHPGLNRKAVSHINSMPSLGSRGQQAGEALADPSISPTQVPLEPGSPVEVTSNTGVTVYGVIRWMGVPAGKTSEWAGIELDHEVNGCSDGEYGGQRYFTCRGGQALFVPVAKCSPDSRFHSPPSQEETLNPSGLHPDPLWEDLEEDVPPIPESEALSLLVGKRKGIQGHFNSCYLDTTLFSLFSSSMTVDSICFRPGENEKPVSRTLRKEIVNHLRRRGFVAAESVMNFRRQLGDDTFLKEEKDPEEFITILLQNVLCMEPLLKLRAKGETSQGAYTFQIILEKEQVVRQVPTVQQLLDTSFLSCDLKFEEIPSCLMVQMPRFGKKYKMFPQIIPSTEIDITDLLYNSQRECFICGCLAKYECLQCLPDHKLQPGRIKQYCVTCKTQVHAHPSRSGHRPSALAVPAEAAAPGPPGPRHTMQLFAVLCIHTSHYVSFVKYGPDPRSWLFFDSMADRSGDDQSGHNIPEVRACPELGDFLSRSEEELARADPSQAGELVRRLLCDSYMCLYRSSVM